MSIVQPRPAPAISGSRDPPARFAAVHPRAIELAGRPHPDSAITGRYSLQHAAALALGGSAGLAAFDDARVDDSELVALRSHMVVAGDSTMRPSEARVALELSDDTRIEQAIDHPSGSPERPLTNAQRHDKSWRWQSAPWQRPLHNDSTPFACASRGWRM